MRQDTDFAHWVRHGGSKSISLPLDFASTLLQKFAVEPGDLTGSLLGDALFSALTDINRALPDGQSVNIKATDMTDLRGAMLGEVTGRLGQIRMPVDPKERLINAFGCAEMAA